MARVLMTLLGLALLALGIWLIYLWRAQVLVVVLAVIALGVTFFGLALIIFGISEIAGALAGKGQAPPPPTEMHVAPNNGE